MRARVGSLLAATTIFVSIAALVGGLTARGLASEQLVPGARQALLYVVDPTHTSRLLAFDWSGHPRGSVSYWTRLDWTVAAPHLDAAPDGSAFLQRGLSLTGQFVDRQTRLIANGLVPDLESASYAWSADSTGICLITYASNAGWRLTTETTTGQRHFAATLFQGTEPTLRVTPIACNLSDDRALVSSSSVGSNGEQVGNMFEVHLSTGIVYNFAEHGQRVSGDLVASPTGDIVAENSLVVGGVRLTQIHAVSIAGSDVFGSTEPSSARVIALSGQGRLALVDTGSGVEVLDWWANRVLWHSTDSSIGYAVEPGADSFAISQPGAPACVDPCVKPPATVTIVNREGPAFVLPKKYIPLW